MDNIFFLSFYHPNLYHILTDSKLLNNNKLPINNQPKKSSKCKKPFDMLNFNIFFDFLSKKKMS